MNKIEIEIPEGKIAEMEKNSDSIKITFKSIYAKPRSWEEYCKSYRGRIFYFGEYSKINSIKIVDGLMNPNSFKTLLPSKELAEAFLAYMQLVSLRQAWVYDWEPCWEDGDEEKFCIYNYGGTFKVDGYYTNFYSLSFPTREMAEDFKNCFKDLLEVAKPLI